MLKRIGSIKKYLIELILVTIFIGMLFFAIKYWNELFCTLCWKETIWLVKLWTSNKHLPKVRCKSNLFQLAQAIFMYTSDHQGYLPDHQDWEQQVLVYLKNRQVFRCPDASVKQSQYYRLNPKLSGEKLKKISDPKETILLFECDNEGDPVARHHFMEFRHLCNVVFVDGRVRGLPPYEVFNRLQSGLSIR